MCGAPPVNSDLDIDDRQLEGRLWLRRQTRAACETIARYTARRSTLGRRPRMNYVPSSNLLTGYGVRGELMLNIRVICSGQVFRSLAVDNSLIEEVFSRSSRRLICWCPFSNNDLSCYTSMQFEVVSNSIYFHCCNIVRYDQFFSAASLARIRRHTLDNYRRVYTKR